VLRPEDIVSEENRLFEKAWSLMPRLPLDKIDLLIVDQIGKEISGTGMDTNVIGRDITGYSASLRPDSALTPQIFRIMVRDLSAATHGNGIGIGLADFTTSRLVRALNMRYTYINAVTSIGLQPAKIPIHFDSDRETIQAAVTTLASSSPETLRVVRIANTLSLERLQISECCIDALGGRPGLSTTGIPQPIQFDEAGNLLPF
jgi:hypothetical protein